MNASPSPIELARQLEPLPVKLHVLGEPLGADDSLPQCSSCWRWWPGRS